MYFYIPSSTSCLKPGYNYIYTTLFNSTAQTPHLTLVVVVRLKLALQLAPQSLLNGVHEHGCRDPRVAIALALRKREVLGHDTSLNGVDARGLEGFSEGGDLGGVVELAALDKTTGPGKDGGDGVGGGLLAALVLAPVAGDCAVGCGRRLV